MRKPVSFGVFIAVGLAVAALLAFFVSPQASSQPDGLEKVAAEEGIDNEAQDHALADTPTADYAIRGVDDEGLSTGLAGLVGIAVVFAAAGALFLIVRRTGNRDREGDAAAPAPGQAERAGA